MENKNDMSAEVLCTKSQIYQARLELHRRGLSCTDSKLQLFFRKMHFNRSLRVGDEIKSWDVLKTAEFIEMNVNRDSLILDIGAYASEILCILHRIGYDHLTGVDLNPDISRMPYADKICYVVADFMHTPFESESFDTITSTSVVEHGFNSTALLSEISRLLRPGGYFIASFDYWPDKIDTSDTSFFGMDWKIFSRSEVLAFVREAASYGFTPHGELHLDAGDKPIHCADRDYTFCWLALTKSK
jgi:SAM-dependent methyltransferase